MDLVGEGETELDGVDDKDRELETVGVGVWLREDVTEAPTEPEEVGVTLIDGVTEALLLLEEEEDDERDEESLPEDDCDLEGLTLELGEAPMDSELVPDPVLDAVREGLEDRDTEIELV